MAFLEILTRHLVTRPGWLARNQLSLRVLNDRDWEQRVIVDEAGRGVPWANRSLASIEPRGEWVWVLDDDDLCCYADLVGDLKAIAASEQADVVAVRTYHVKYGVLPPDELWGKEPQLGKITSCSVIASREAWRRCRDGWTEQYAGDFTYIRALWEAGLKWAWLPVFAAWTPEAHFGASETSSVLRRIG